MPLKVTKKGEAKPHKAAPAARVKILQPKPSEDFEAIKSKLADVETQQAQIHRDRLTMTLEKAKIKPEYHDYAISKLGPLDLTKKADLAKIDAFAKAHTAMVEPAAATAKPAAKSAWLEGYKADPAKPRLGDFIPRGAVPTTAGGDRE